jgi:RimJ/RimL family protein N-acetyltransferase
MLMKECGLNKPTDILDRMLSIRVMSICDDCGLNGATRSIIPDDENVLVCEACARLIEKNRSVRISPIDSSDLELVLAWRSNPLVYRYSRHQDGPLDWETHINWFESREPDRHDFMIRFDGRRVGVVSLDTTDHVSIYLGDINATGQGVATAALQWICQRFEERAPLYAEIHSENDESEKLFLRCDFVQKARDGEWKKFVYKSE